MDEEGLVFRRRKAWLENICNDNKIDLKKKINGMSVFDENLADVLISNYDYLYSCISNENFSPSLNNNLVLLLKFILENGSYLDSNLSYKEQIDMYFSLFRNILRNHLKSLPESINLLILRLIEIRACKWKINLNVEEYYMKKVDKNSKQTASQLTFNEDFSKCSNNLRTSKSFGDILTGYANEDLTNRNCKQTKNKSFIKDEVVIKNSDSGKVMGIKGRRVHMIEEISDTVISFQKAVPGAKERSVQISGSNKENIDKAKSLIDDTIKKNTSPIPFNDYNENMFEAPIQDPLCPEGHQLTINHQNKNVTVFCSNIFIGKKLEEFINQFNFKEFIESSSDNESVDYKITIGGDSFNSNNNNNNNEYITYDRDFLLKLRNNSVGNRISNVISDIKLNRMELFRANTNG